MGAQLTREREDPRELLRSADEMPVAVDTLVQERNPYLGMKLSFVQPRLELKPFIQSFWVPESAVGSLRLFERRAMPG